MPGNRSQMLDIGRVVHAVPRLRVARVVVDWLIPDLEVAYCSDRKGRKYTIDRRSAVSFSALSEGMRLQVRATDNGLVKSLVFDD